MNENRRTKDRIAKIYFDDNERIVEVVVMPTKLYQKWYCIFDESRIPSRIWLDGQNSEYSYYRIKANV